MDFAFCIFFRSAGEALPSKDTFVLAGL